MTEDFKLVFERANKAMAKHALEGMERARYFYLGYTRLEEANWLRFNRVFHGGRKIKIKDLPVTIRISDDTLQQAKPIKVLTPHLDNPRPIPQRSQA